MNNKPIAYIDRKGKSRRPLILSYEPAISEIAPSSKQDGAPAAKSTRTPLTAEQRATSLEIIKQLIAEAHK